MNITRQVQIRNEARGLLARCWRERKTYWSGIPINLNDFLIYAPEKIVTEILHLSYTMVNAIESSEALFGRRHTGEIVGILDRINRHIVVASSRGYPESRFTLAHEIGHCQLHPGMVLHRERPFDFSSDLSRRSPIEREADLFGAELLMPSRLVRNVFMKHFGGIIDAEHSGEAACFWLEQGDSRFDKEKFLTGD